MKNPETEDFLALHNTPDPSEELGLDFHPTSFDEYLGQRVLKEKLSIYTQAAKMRNEPLDHLLLFGPPGLGKTTLATIMARVMDVSIKLCSGPTLERTGDLVSIISSLEPRDILFIDEIHRMPTNVEEVLYSALEHFRIDVVIGQGAGARSVSLPTSPFTLIGATTKSGKISAPLQSRFGIIERIDFYTDTELAEIVKQSAKHLFISFSHESALVIGGCARGTPRIAKKIVRRIRDYAQVIDQNNRSRKTVSAAAPEIGTINKNNRYPKILIINDKLVEEALTFIGIDKEGLTPLDIMLLKKIIEYFNGGPVGLETLASLVGEDADTIETVYEPFLLRKGYLEKTTRGRQIPAARLPLLMKKLLGQQTIL